MNVQLRTFAILSVLMLLVSGAWAHKPVVVDGGPTTAATAYVIADPSVSQVGYHERTATQPELWFTFHAEAGDKLSLQAGVPKIDRYQDLRPVLALLGPGLPSIDVPFELPAGYGGILYSTLDETPVVFNEEFTGTDSWQFAAHEPVLAQSGDYYLVGFTSNAQDGKFWMVIGTKEAFGFKDILSLPSVLFKVRAFHEIGPFGGLLFWAMFLVFLALFFVFWLLL